ncbi:MAG: Flp family type IVb pilin [Dehalococcoidia bacterium]|jgi:Flp pilus assembly pilin Flp
MLDELVVKLLILKTWLSSERGQDIMEYALLAGFIAVGFAVAAAGILDSGVFTKMADTIKNCVDFDSSTACGP